MQDTDPSKAYGPPERLAFPEDEAAYPWLSRLLDAYYTADRGVAEGIRRAEAEGRTLACARGCATCCETHATIPVYPLELMGLSWYATEKLAGPWRERLKTRLQGGDNGCPFLIDGVCVVHPVRPMACRHFNVFDRPCAEGEDPYYSRRGDVLTPIARFKDEALDTTLPYYGIKTKHDRRQALKSGAVHRLARVMRDCNWASLAQRMAAFGRGDPVSRARPPG